MKRLLDKISWAWNEFTGGLKEGRVQARIESIDENNPFIQAYKDDEEAYAILTGRI